MITAASDRFAHLKFQYPFRKYQRMILELIGQSWQKDRQHHLVAPPGSGKTIVGLELIRQFGRPAVVFCPTTTIQKQWQEKVGLFTEDETWLQANVSTDARNVKPMTILTYQILSTPGENLAFVEQIAVEQWQEDLIKAGQVEDLAQAQARVAQLRSANPKAARSEISKRYRRVKRTFLKDETFDGRQFLHENAKRLIDQLVELDVGTVVLDECHHLLDYWAFILRELLHALPDVHVVGLTATLPEPGNQSEFENYESLLGDIDFEVPTPAVVKEGNLAPYRDLVYFCQPTKRETNYLKRIHDHFLATVKHLTAPDTVNGGRFEAWVYEQLGADRATFTEFLNKNVLLCVAMVRYLLGENRPVPPSAAIIPEMRQPLDIADWLTLLEHYALRRLKVSQEKAEQDQYKLIRTALLDFGITISERGIRHQRSPGDLILALSEAKTGAAVDILRREHQQMGPQLRAVVITDFERMSARTRRLNDVLDPEAGSAVRVFRRLIENKDTNKLDPVLVTGKIVMLDADNRARMEEGIRAWQSEQALRFDWSCEATSDPRVLELTGSGPDWRSSTYVAMITALLEQGVTQCLVGTRGIFGEGWDALTLNTLVDLTSVTTSTGVQQIRGRSLRIDPAWQKKVAHNWDVVCVSKRFDKGDADLRRFVSKHAHVWGIITQSRLREFVDGVGTAIAGGQVAMPLRGRIVRGVAHVDLGLAQDLLFKHFKKLNFSRVNERMLKAIAERDEIYTLWDVGGDYDNFQFRATQIMAEDIKFQTVFNLRDSLRALLWRLLTSVAATAFLIVYMGGRILLDVGATLPSAALLCLSILIPASVLVAIIVNGRAVWKLYQRAFKRLPVELILRDMASAVLQALIDVGAVSRNLAAEYVRVVTTDGGGFTVFLDYASPEDATTFATAIEQMVGPLDNARYLIRQDSRALGNPIYRSLWWFVRVLSGTRDPAADYYRVPDVLASRKARAEKFEVQWKRFVGGGELIYTRSEKGRLLLLDARAQRKLPIRQMAFETWR